ncbi:TPA: glycosyltransferase family 1 protein, partial [Escherichia coli]
MDELIRRKLFKPYRKLNKQSCGSQRNTEVNFERLFILHEGKSSTLAYFESAIISRFPDAEYH